MATLINMENTPQEAKEQVSPAVNPPAYPWGLCLTLNEDSLEKLGVKTLPAAGTVVTIVAKAAVAGTSERQIEDGTTRSSMDLQITEMQIDGLDKDLLGRAAELLYGKKS